MIRCCLRTLRSQLRVRVAAFFFTLLLPPRSTHVTLRFPFHVDSLITHTLPGYYTRLRYARFTAPLILIPARRTFTLRCPLRSCRSLRTGLPPVYVLVLLHVVAFGVSLRLHTFTLRSFAFAFACVYLVDSCTTFTQLRTFYSCLPRFTFTAQLITALLFVYRIRTRLRLDFWCTLFDYTHVITFTLQLLPHVTLIYGYRFIDCCCSRC